jgi:hypothetical protein
MIDDDSKIAVGTGVFAFRAISSGNVSTLNDNLMDFFVCDFSRCREMRTTSAKLSALLISG